MPLPRIATMRARRTLSVTDFRKNPSRHMRDAMGDTLAVLSRNRVEFYAVPPERFEALIDRVEALEGVGRREG
jgi:antitoxin StbD